MTLYAEDPSLRARQFIADALVLLWVAGWIWVGRGLHRLVSALAGPGRFLEDAGEDFARSAGGAGNQVDDLPVLGDRLAAPFDAVADGGTAVAQAGLAQQDAVATLALALALFVALVPIVPVLAVHIPRRVRWSQRATAARALIDGTGGDLRLFALRALAHQPLDRLRGVAPDPAAAYERDDRAVVAALAALELRSLGVVAERRAPS